MFTFYLRYPANKSPGVVRARGLPRASCRDSVANDGDPGNDCGDDCKSFCTHCRLLLAYCTVAHGFTLSAVARASGRRSAMRRVEQRGFIHFAPSAVVSVLTNPPPASHFLATSLPLYRSKIILAKIDGLRGGRLRPCKCQWGRGRRCPILAL